MSNVYASEPRTNGKVTLQTSHGPLHIELWSKECPLACRNFIQLCLEGYYDGSPFHRIVPGFCVQSGLSVQQYTDAVEGESEEGAAAINGGRFAIETHSRLRFSRRGLLGMAATAPASNDSKLVNTSQFFFTLSEAPELTGKATLFGCLVGDSIYNLLRIGEVEVDGERPVWAPKILNATVQQNPFDDIIPREREIVQKSAGERQEKPAPGPKKNAKLLSFEEDEETGHQARIKSSHDLLNDPKLSKAVNNVVEGKSAVNAGESRPSAVKQNSVQAESTPAETQPLSFLEQMKAAQMKEMQKKIAQVEAELRGTKSSSESAASTKAAPPAKPLSALEKHRQKWMQGGRAQAAKRKPDARDEMDTLLKLNSFRSKIQKTANEAGPEAEVDEKEASPSAPSHVDICKLHGLINCLSCRDTFGVRLEDGPEDEKGWMLHKLVFDRRELDSSIREDLKQLVVIDPREQMKNVKN